MGLSLTNITNPLHSHVQYKLNEKFGLVMEYQKSNYFMYNIDEQEQDRATIETRIPNSLGGYFNDDEIVDNVTNFSNCLNILEIDLDWVIKARSCPGLTMDEHIKLDTYLTYANSTLFWMYLKLQGTDLSKHSILNDLEQSKEMLARGKQVEDSKSAPHLDIAASRRFIAAGLHTRFVDMDGVMVTEEQYQYAQTEASSTK